MTTRQLMEKNVCGVNKFLKAKAKNMTIAELLYNMHPSDRADFLRDKELVKQIPADIVVKLNFELNKFYFEKQKQKQP